MVYLYDACDQISDFCHQQLLRKMRRKISLTDGRTDRGKTVYPPPPSGSGGIINTRNNIPTGFGCRPHNHPNNQAKVDAKQIINRQGLFLSLHSSHMEKNPTHWSTSHLQKQCRHSTTCKKSSCFTTHTDGFIIEDVWFNALNDLEDIDIPANTTTFTDYVTTQVSKIKSSMGR